MMRQSRGEKIAERLGWILLQLYTGNSLSVNDICQQFSVSRRTGRRDLLRVETVTENSFSRESEVGSPDKRSSQARNMQIIFSTWT